MFGMSETPIRIFVAYQRTSIYNGDYKKSYFGFERRWENGAEVLDIFPRISTSEPTIPEEIVVDDRREESRFQRFINRIMGHENQPQFDLEGQIQYGPVQIPEPIPAQNQLAAGTEDCYVKKVVLK